MGKMAARDNPSIIVILNWPNVWGAAQCGGEVGRVFESGLSLLL
jgi:hypothetical protein